MIHNPKKGPFILDMRDYGSYMLSVFLKAIPKVQLFQFPKITGIKTILHN